MSKCLFPVLLQMFLLLRVVSCLVYRMVTHKALHFIRCFLKIYSKTQPVYVLGAKTPKIHVKNYVNIYVANSLFLLHYQTL